MPATRSGTGSKQSRAPSASTRLSRKPSTTLADEVISIGSSEGSSSAMFPHLSPSLAGSHIRSPSRAKSASSRRPVPVSTEVIEISSDEDEPAVSRRSAAASSSATSDMRRQIKKLKEERDRYRHEAQSANRQLDVQRQKVRTLEIQTSLAGSKVGLNDSELDDIISCAVCTNTMFTPYIIPGCGHTFCQACLTDWFDATLRNFMTNHPHYNPNQLYQPAMAQTIAQLLANPHTMLDPRVMQFIQQNTLPRPQYTCPGCRSAVKSPPIENFSMKSLSRMVTAAKKEPIPNVPLRPRDGLWDGYFPPALRR